MSDAKLPFEIPFFASDMLEDETQKIFDAFLAAGHKTPDGAVIIALRMYAMVDAQDTEHIEPCHNIGLWVENDDGAIQSATARDLEGTARRGFNDVAGAWALDDMIQQSIMAHPLQWRGTPGRTHSSGGRLLTYVHLKGLSALMQEYIPTFLEDGPNDPLGPGFAEDQRTSLASVIVPPCASNHEKLNALKDIQTGYARFEKIWDLACEEDFIPLVQPDLTNPRDIH